MANQQQREESPVIDNSTGEVIELEQLGSGVGSMIAAEINQQVATAKRYPRRRDKDISDEIVGRAGFDETFAAECMYSVKRADEMIVGPSIRFAELVRASYGNIRVAARFLRIDDDNPERAAVLCEAIALDLQNNQSETVGIRRSIMTSGRGDRKPRIYSADMINMTVNAAQSLVRRNVILAVVPKVLWLPGYHRAVKIIGGEGKTLVARREEVIAAFGRIKIEPAEVFAALGVKGIDDITVSHLPALIGMLNAIKDGETADAVLGRFRAEAGPVETIKDPLKDGAHAGNGKGAGSPQPEQRQDATAGGAPVSEGQGGRGLDDPRYKDDRITTGPQGGQAEGGAKAAEPEKAARTAGEPRETAKSGGNGGSAEMPMFPSAEALISWVHDFLDTAKSGASVTDMWGRLRIQKNALLDQEQIDELTADKEAKLRALKK